MGLQFNSDKFVVLGQMGDKIAKVGGDSRAATVDQYQGNFALAINLVIHINPVNGHCFSYFFNFHIFIICISLF
ncbi:hypothetical protein D3C85_1918080 [compost metagenome]